MTAFWAIVGDTWRQSKHQWVMLVMLLCFAFVIWLALSNVDTRVAPDGETILTTQTEEEFVRFGLEAQWEGLYADSLRHEIGYEDQLAEGRREVSKLFSEWSNADYQYQKLVNEGAPIEQIQAAQDRAREIQTRMEAKEQANRDDSNYVRGEVNRIIAERTKGLSKLEKGAEWWLASVVQMLYMVAMIGFIAVCAGYFPGMLEAGNVDLMMSKPIRRWHIYFGKYVGGLLLFSLILLIAYVLIFVGVGFKTGIWHWKFFGALPMTLFSLALLFSIIAWVGLWTRSTLMSAILGLVYYVIVDSAVGYLGDLGGTPFLANVPAIKQMGEIVKFIFPSFVWLRESAEAAVLSVYVFPWKHVVVGVIWLVVCLGTAYNRFRINDY
jgi:ABC-type transport system involved in multi-copper enzyme maturation permease subunit